MELDAKTPGVSLEELDLTAVTGGEDRGLTVELLWREKTDGESGPIVEREAKRFPIRGSLAIPMMTSLLRLETQINDALASDDETADRALEKALTAGHAKIVSLITDRTRDAFAEREVDGKTLAPSIEMDVSQILVTLSWIAGDLTVADAVARTLTGGSSGAKTEAELVDESEQAAARGEKAPESGAPLASRSPS